ncbi:HNH endonuclease [Paenibacillus polymyxa]|uniref:HNH endonuclease n=1 Tax=Paenibacillus polymyxa TaxID=1406 RepID=UPI0004966ED7|nr:hypothetical protein [Paenibacillus polymyxa]
MALAKRKKPIPEWRQSILAHHNRRDHPKKKRAPVDPEVMSKEKVRAAVSERDATVGAHNCCLLSGRPGPGLHLHRIIYGSQGGKYEVDNCVLLSYDMHALVHSNKRVWQPILLDHIKAMKYEPDMSPIYQARNL